MISRDLIELPLYDAFARLMELEKSSEHRSVDPNSYLALVETLHSGYMLNSDEELIFFCKKLWLKPFHRENNIITEKLVEDLVRQSLARYATSNDPGKTAENKSPRTADNSLPTAQTEKQNTDSPVTNAKEETKPAADIKLDDPVLKPEESKGDLCISIEEVEAGNKMSERSYASLFNDKSYQFNYEYLPVSRRFIEQTIRSLRYKVKGAGKPALDVAATVKEAAIKGRFENWEMREEDAFTTKWTLLLDHEGSMIAFESLQKALVEAAFNGTLPNEGDVFYFRNLPGNFLYLNAEHTESISLRTFAASTRRNILIVSDAGAARGYLNEDRIQQTYTLLHRLRKHRIAWLNPLPRERWKNTSADIISDFVHMFETGDDNGDNLGNIVRLFKSKITSRSMQK